MDNVTIINGVELPAVDWGDAEVLEAYYNSLNEFSALQDRMAKSKDSVGSFIDAIREMSDVIADWLDDIFGDGAGDKVFGGKASLRLCNCVARDLISAVQDDLDEIKKEQEQFAKEAALRNLERRGSRQERRAAAQQNTSQGKRKKRRQQMQAHQASQGPVDPSTFDRYDPQRTEQ